MARKDTMEFELKVRLMVNIKSFTKQTGGWTPTRTELGKVLENEIEANLSEFGNVGESNAVFGEIKVMAL